MPPKINQAWAELHNKMKSKRSKDQRVKKIGSAPHELIVQRLAAEPDHKQTYKAVQPREFVAYECEDLTLTSLKKACIRGLLVRILTKFRTGRTRYKRLFCILFHMRTIAPNPKGFGL